MIDVGEANCFVATGSLFSQQMDGGVRLPLAVGIVGQGGVDGVAAGVEGTEQDPDCAALFLGLQLLQDVVVLQAGVEAQLLWFVQAAATDNRGAARRGGRGGGEGGGEEGRTEGGEEEEGGGVVV
jgi:hypothetical protein